MPVDITIDQLLNALRLTGSTPVTSEITRLHGYATEFLQPIAANAPNSVLNQAVIQYVGYLYNRPMAAPGEYAAAFRNSGAGEILAPYRDGLVPNTGGGSGGGGGGGTETSFTWYVFLKTSNTDATETEITAGVSGIGQTGQVAQLASPSSNAARHIGIALPSALGDPSSVNMANLTGDTLAGTWTKRAVATVANVVCNVWVTNLALNAELIPTTVQVVYPARSTGGGGGGGSTLTGPEIVALLSALTGDARLAAAAIRGLPDGLTGPAIVALLSDLTGNARLPASAVRDIPSGTLTAAQIVTLLTGLTGNARLPASAVRDILAAVDAIPFGMLFDTVISRTASASLSSTDGELTVSAGNNPPTAPDNTNVDALIIDRDDAAGNSQKALLDTIQAGDWFRVVRGSRYIIAKIAAVTYHDTDQAYYLWFNPSTQVAETLAYDDIGTGAAEVRLYRAQSIRDALPTGTELNESQIDTTTALLLKTFASLTAGELVEWHDDHHTGQHSLTGYTYTTSSLTQVSPAGRVAVSGGIGYVTPLNDADKASLKSKLVSTREFTIWVSATRYKTMKLTSTVSEFQGVLAFNVGSITDVGAALTNNHAVSLRVDSNIPARSELAQQAFKENEDNIAGKGGTQGDVWTRGSSETNAGWATPAASGGGPSFETYTGVGLVSAAHTFSPNFTVAVGDTLYVDIIYPGRINARAVYYIDALNKGFAPIVVYGAGASAEISTTSAGVVRINRQTGANLVGLTVRLGK